MSYFSRLTDIVTCNLSDLLSKSPDPKAAIEQVLREMDEGLSGARRSVATAAANEERMARDIQEHRNIAASWAAKAKDHLIAGREPDARQALVRKREVEDLIAGLEQQHHSAVATREHLATMQRAVEARYAEAVRKHAALSGDAPPQPATSSGLAAPADDRMSQVDAELEALKREIGE
jgi:phage shock protein A